MIEMIIKMSAVTAIMVALTVMVWYWSRNNKLTAEKKALIGVIFGLAAIASTHYGIAYENMIINVRDFAPLSAGLFFDPVSGIIAGMIGGIERYIAGTYFGVGSYTRIACSVSTCLAGFLAAIFNVKLFKGRKPSAFYTFFIGAVMEVFHMYVVFITHRSDMKMAFYVVDTCAIPMIIFTGLGMAASSLMLYALSGQLKDSIKSLKGESRSISTSFQAWLFVCTVGMFILTFAFSYKMQTQSAIQDAQETMTINSNDAKVYIQVFNNRSETRDSMELSDFNTFITHRHVGETGSIYVIDRNDVIVLGDNAGKTISDIGLPGGVKSESLSYFNANVFGQECYCRYENTDNGYSILTTMSLEELYRARKTSAYETAFADILLFTLVFILIYVLVQLIIVNNLNRINASLAKITRGDLNEVVEVNASSEFASLSNDINLTVSALKGYIDQAEKRIEEELEFARAIQEAALPRVFSFPRDEIELFASMDPAKEVGGDFYDFFFVDKNKIALVIADVSGKGIPAALFMMRSKTEIKSLAEAGISPAEIFKKANDALAEGNDACMFVTAWVGIIDLETGEMQCANAGHEYPVIKRANGRFELLRDKHDSMLAIMSGMPFSEYKIQLSPCDELFVYTDGIPEAIDENEEQYGTDRMTAALNRLKDKSVSDILPGVREDIRAFVGQAEQFDDITMLGIEFRHKAEE